MEKNGEEYTHIGMRISSLSSFIRTQYYCVTWRELLRVLKKGSNPQEEKSDLQEEKKNPQEEKKNPQEEKTNLLQR